jgi:LmbE family N-acetylglucosaminyl deacetylase
MVIFDSAATGTSAADWRERRDSTDIPELDLSTISGLCVVAAHPDDESLGAGGLLAECARLGVPLQVVVVTDGAASHPQSSTTDAQRIADLRRRELFLAIAELAPRCEITTLGFPDGETDGYRNEIGAALRRNLARGTTIVSPWRGDGHRDHRVVAEICVDIARSSGSTLLEYPIWMWHWASPSDDRVPWRSAVQLSLNHATRHAKRRAISQHASQVIGLGPGDGDRPVLTADFLAHFDQDREVFLVVE